MKMAILKLTRLLVIAGIFIKVLVKKYFVWMITFCGCKCGYKWLLSKLNKTIKVRKTSLSENIFI